LVFFDARTRDDFFAVFLFCLLPVFFTNLFADFVTALFDFLQKEFFAIFFPALFSGLLSALRTFSRMRARRSSVLQLRWFGTIGTGSSCHRSGRRKRNAVLGGQAATGALNRSKTASNLMDRGFLLHRAAPSAVPLARVSTGVIMPWRPRVVCSQHQGPIRDRFGVEFEALERYFMGIDGSGLRFSMRQGRECRKADKSS
jgi:hypothetical protein